MEKFYAVSPKIFFWKLKHYAVNQNYFFFRKNLFLKISKLDNFKMSNFNFEPLIIKTP